MELSTGPLPASTSSAGIDEAQSIMQYQLSATPMVPVHVEGIGDLSALTDTGAEEPALHPLPAGDTISPRTQPPIHGLGSVIPIVMLGVYVRGTAATKFLLCIPVFEGLTANIILGTDFLLAYDI
ncbi:hypothetical protein HPB50_026470 [Hyalomma asiaticum]|uniref:Uncharacterized protein n=1 Tax=Hyalomma asiaticum TaxID=266040 RepID=A0ACB7T2A6_HYAAI|nr:hypothetical protein HPB50_026470 [Hyalomma asiaticum]